MTGAEKTILAMDNLTVELKTGSEPIVPVNRVSLAIEQGKTLALVGESGSGKSMLCRAIMGLLPPGGRMTEAARLVYDGRELAGVPEQQRQRILGREIGVVLQNPLSSLNPVMTIGSQIMEPLRCHLGMNARAGREKALALLGAVGIPCPEERQTCYPHQLSGGMRQRVAIAIALACDPRLLIADEPTTALDVTVQAEIIALLTRLQRERNMAILLVSHDLGVVAGMAHEIAVMYAGRIVERAPARELFSRMRMPYTRALLDAIPRLDDPPHSVLRAIGGQPPDLATELTGCPFAPRCDRRADRCTAEEPPLVKNDGRAGHHYACWFPCDGRDL